MQTYVSIRVWTYQTVARAARGRIMYRALRLLTGGSIPNGIARYGKALGQNCPRRMSTATRTPGSSSRSVQSNVDSRLLIGGGVSLVGVAFAVRPQW